MRKNGPYLGPGMTEPSLAALGNGGAPRKAKAAPVDERPLLDVSQPFEIGYCTFDQPFFNTASRTVSIGDFFAAGDSFTEGIVTRMVMHPNGMVEARLDSNAVPGKVTVAVLYNPKNCSPLALDMNDEPIQPNGSGPVKQMYRSALAGKEA